MYFASIRWIGGMSALAMIIVIPLFSPTIQQQPWTSIAPGVVSRSIGATVASETLFVNVIRIDPRATSIRIVHVYGTLSERPGQYGYTLDEIVKRTRPTVAINGGFSDAFSLPTPVGLLKVNGQIVAALRANDSIQTGILCVSRTGAVRIVRRSRYVDGECWSAIQSGPTLIEANRVVVSEEESRIKDVSRRSAACIDIQGNIVLAASSNPVHLYPFALLLHDRRSNYGLRCQTALNLSGDLESGLVFQHGRQHFRTGSIQTPIASAILVMKKT